MTTKETPKFEGKSKFEYTGKKIIAHLFEDGVEKRSTNLPEITDIKVYHSKDGAALLVTFGDNSFVTAVTRGSDEYSLENGLSICLAKKLLGDKCGGWTYSNNVYNKWMEHALKTVTNLEKKKEEAKKKEEEHKRFLEKVAEKKRRRAERRKQKAIEIQKEAYLRAMQEYKKSKKD